MQAAAASAHHKNQFCTEYKCIYLSAYFFGWISLENEFKEMKWIKLNYVIKARRQESGRRPESGLSWLPIIPFSSIKLLLIYYFGNAISLSSKPRIRTQTGPELWAANGGQTANPETLSSKEQTWPGRWRSLNGLSAVFGWDLVWFSVSFWATDLTDIILIRIERGSKIEMAVISYIGITGRMGYVKVS